MPMFFVSLKEAYFVCHWCLLFIEEFRILELYVGMIFRFFFFLSVWSGFFTRPNQGCQQLIDYRLRI